MKKKFFTFRNIYLIYLLLMVVMIVVCVVKINGILHRYEEIRPEARVEQLMAELQEDAASGEFFTVYEKPVLEAGRYEQNIDVEKEYLAQYASEALTYTHKGGSVEEEELLYVIENDGLELAEVKFKAAGPMEQKLLILNMREWDVEYVKPLLEKKEYTVSVPENFKVQVSDIVLDEDAVTEEKEGMVTYAIKEVYLKPDILITNKEDKEVAFTYVNQKIIPEFYNYVLTLPSSLTVKVNGEEVNGELLANNVRYTIELLEKPDIIIEDMYGNSHVFVGGGEIPLTYMRVTAEDKYIVKVDGQEVTPATEAINHPEYLSMLDYTDSLPTVNEYDVAVLANDAVITVEDKDGNLIPLKEGEVEQDLTSYHEYLESVPEEISTEVDVLHLAQQWSLFMSADVPFSQIKQYFINGSYQYNVARKYATGIDITFTSSHTLTDPPFTDCKVTNFVWINDNAFSVDISFVKHMILRDEQTVDDSMNDRFYFLKYDDTKDNVDNPAWKIVSMKEIVN